MADLTTEYLGLKLSNPFVVASCSLTKTSKGVKLCYDAGAGAIVLKSLFEEEIQFDTDQMKKSAGPFNHSEAYNYLENIGMGSGARHYLQLIKESKRAVPVPVIASLNCISGEWWVDYAKQIELAGADAIELNISMMPVDFELTAKDIEEKYFNIIGQVKKQVDIPIAAKIGSNFTSIARMARDLCRKGISGLVLFNRFYQPDIDIEKFELTHAYNFSSPEDMGVSLRWIALLNGLIDCDFAASTGVHDSAGAIKQLLAGASVVQLCSTLYLNGLKQISSIREELEGWMNKHNFDSVEQFRGKMSKVLSDKPEEYERLQYIKALTGIE
ncbi:dihydroorotate dehydrogenase-like protein [bacterium]|nr:dihydroorotate dehydrogenase-like protein [bacterium]